ncbi:MAG: hypothetical protein HFJ30_10355 [Clostridia bacterium]|nr:hypothetical protein [Clostridia bacterium]
MARKRMIDPNIWQSEDFGKLSLLAKIVFIGLFSLADDEGRGRANPVYLKSTLFPYEESMRSADITKSLFEISSNMSVIFYSCDGSDYYSLYNWDTWQKIDKPTNSKIPAFEENNEEIRQLFVEGSSKASRRVSPNRIEKNKNRIRIEIEKNRIEVKEIYNSTCTNLPQVQKLTDKRNKAIDNFLKEFTEEQFKRICEIANNSDFLTGNNERKWKADFDFLMRIDKATNVLEGKYSNSSGGMNDFKELMEEARQADEQTGNNTDNNSSSW